MTSVATDKGITCEQLDCMEACALGCFYESEDMLVVRPDT